MADADRDQPLAYRINDLHNHVPWGRSKTFELVKQGRLRARKLDGATLILRRDLEDFLESLDIVGASTEISANLDAA